MHSLNSPQLIRTRIHLPLDVIFTRTRFAPSACLERARAHCCVGRAHVLAVPQHPTSHHHPHARCTPLHTCIACSMAAPTALEGQSSDVLIFAKPSYACRRACARVTWPKKYSPALSLSHLAASLSAHAILRMPDRPVAFCVWPSHELAAVGVAECGSVRAVLRQFGKEDEEVTVPLQWETYDVYVAAHGEERSWQHAGAGQALTLGPDVLSTAWWTRASAAHTPASTTGGVCEMSSLDKAVIFQAAVPCNVSTHACPRIPGCMLIHNFISEEEEAAMLRDIDARPWNHTLTRKVQHYNAGFDYISRVISGVNVGDDGSTLTLPTEESMNTSTGRVPLVLPVRADSVLSNILDRVQRWGFLGNAGATYLDTMLHDRV
ncbi:hypothetical protein EON67_10095, partial [archaeon]